MAYTTIDDPSAHFQTTLYTGNGSTQSITNSGNSNLQPDWLWIKERTSTSQHFLFDSTRGVGKYLHSDSTSTEGNDVHNTSFDSNGFGVGQQNGTNENSQTYVAWQWKANGATTTTNDASSTSVGTIDSVYQANTTAGFSIVTYTGTGSAGTIAHGLGATPKLYIIKNRERSDTWRVATEMTGFAKQLLLDDTDTVATDTATFNNTAPTSTVFSVGTRNAVNASSEGHVAYCFAEKKGYSKMGFYEGNGDADGTFVYTGFQPEFILIKNIDATFNWMLFDNTRDEAVINSLLEANTPDTERVDDKIDFVSNGFKLRSTSGENNGSYTFIYMAFAKHPFVSSEGVPVTAR